MIDHHRALIYAMVLTAASDGNMTDTQVHAIGESIRYLPVFQDFHVDQLPDVVRECGELLRDPAGAENAIDLIHRSLSRGLRETAYMLSCEVIASDQTASDRELHLLELLRHGLELDRLTAAALERGARARYTVA